MRKIEGMEVIKLACSTARELVTPVNAKCSMYTRHYDDNNNDKQPKLLLPPLSNSR